MAAYVVQITQANGPDTVTLDATSSPNVLNVTDGSTFASLTVNANTASPLIVDPDPKLSANLNLNGNDITGTGNITTTGDVTLTGTANATTVDTTNIEVTNLKAKDGTSAGSIADSTGVVTLASSVLTTTDINGGTIDGTTIGGSTPAAITGTTITGTGFVTTGDMTFGDNDKAIFGAGSDLSIYHDGSNSYIEEAGTGALKITSNGTSVDFESAGGETLAQFETDGAVTLYHNNSQKLATTSTGIDVTGNAAVSDKVKIGTGADGGGTGDELVLSKDQTNVGMSILAADATGSCRIFLGSQTAVTAAKIQHTESNSRLFIQAEGDLYFQTGGTSTTMTLNTSGDLDVTGALSKGSGSFKISHPLKPDTHHLVHSFLEGPQADNLYRGTVALVGGAATVNLDTAGRMAEGTFVALNGNVQCFTTNEQGWTAVRGSVSGNTLTIEAQDETCTDTVSWMVIGERHDQHMIDTAWTDADGRVITEPEKPPVEEEDTE